MYNINLPEGEPFFKKERKKTCPRMLGTLTCLTKTDGQVSSLTCQEQEKKQGQFAYKYKIHKLQKLAIP